MRFVLCLFLLAASAVAGFASPRADARTTARPVVIAVVDSGVTTSPALAGRLLAGHDFVDQDANAADEYGHGTELAGIVAAQCPRCLILPVRVLGRGGQGSVPTIIQGIQWAVEHGARVINLSMTTESDNPDLSAAIQSAVSHGVTMTLAAGNQGAPVGYPAATSPDAIAVGSVDRDGNRFSWSNYGPWVNVLAPGTISARSLQGKRVSAVGTSASAAYVAGAAGRLLGCDGSLLPAAVKGLLESDLSHRLC
jgi:thermitase